MSDGTMWEPATINAFALFPAPPQPRHSYGADLPPPLERSPPKGKIPPPSGKRASPPPRPPSPRRISGGGGDIIIWGTSAFEQQYPSGKSSPGGSGSPGGSASPAPPVEHRAPPPPPPRPVVTPNVAPNVDDIFARQIELFETSARAKAPTRARATASSFGEALGAPDSFSAPPRLKVPPPPPPPPAARPDMDDFGHLVRIRESQGSSASSSSPRVEDAVADVPTRIPAPSFATAANPFPDRRSSFVARSSAATLTAMTATLTDLEADAAKRRREKKHSLDELAQTEQTYREQLSAFVETLQRPLKQYCELRGGATLPNGGQPPLEDVQALCTAFSPLPAEALLEISDNLVKALDRRTNPYNDAIVMIGDVFEQLAPKVHDAMCSWYDWHERADSELRRLKEKSDGVRAFVDDAARDPRCIDHQVSSLLIAPTQRLVRQMLFLERLEKTTPDHHADAPNLRKAHKLWKEILEACNKVAGNHAMQRRAEALERVLDGAPPSVVVTAPGRFLTHEGSLTKIGSTTVRPDYFFLFETLSATELLHTSAPDTNGRFAYKRFLRVLHVEDVELASGNCDATTGAVKRNSLYLAAGKLGVSTSSRATAGGGPYDGAHSAPCDSTLLLRIVASYPSDPKKGHVYSLAGDRDNIVEWKSKITKALGKNTAEWKLRFKGDISVLGEGFASYPCAEVKDASLKDSFMWFFSGRFGGMIVRATTGTARSGKLAWYESLRVEALDASEVPLHTLRGDRLRKRCLTDPRDVFRIVCVEKTLVVASEDKDLLVELMKPQRPPELLM
ncbi:hypothetical protein CTAYLR_000272 [Chrysophaeum taylorii]|uniref:DH domain-containing protein n=1 Tax=Chrysophaeum taylorii TaxID=2483200 RepID=A0AAD7XM73_9STRA|nr:hypothetical protein CTAYLR_000272 [Chrysophaeum taylorii]